MFFKKITIVFMFILVPLSIFCDSSENKIKKNWNASAFLSFTLSKGNSNGKTYSGQAQYKYNRKFYAFNFSYEQYYGKTDEKVNLNKGKAFLTFNRTIKNKLNISSSAIYEYDRIALMSYRINYGLGISYSNRDDPKNSFVFTSNLVYEKTHYNSDIKENKKSIRMLFLIQSNISLLNNSFWETSMSYTPNVVNPDLDYRVEIKSSVKFLINAPIWFKFSVLNQYNNNPPNLKIDKNDFTMVAGIELSV